MEEASYSAYGEKGPVVLAATWSQASLAIILIALRAKTASICPPGHPWSGFAGLRWDFIWVMVALTMALCSQSLLTVSVSHGLGNHQHLLSYHDIVQTNLWSWMAQVVAIVCLIVARFAVIAFLLSIQAGTAHRGAKILYTVGCLQGIINVIEVVLIIRQCDPPAKLWDSELPGKCGMILVCSQVGYLQGSIGVAADLLLAFYPVYIIGRLQHMKLSTRIGLCLIMGGGVIAAIAGINKTVAITAITGTQDLTYATYQLNIWSITEVWFIIIFGSIPVLRPFFIRFTQDIKRAAGHYQEHELDSSGYITGDRNVSGSWRELDERSQRASQRVWVTHDHREVLEGHQGRQILVTKDTTVVAERC